MLNRFSFFYLFLSLIIFQCESSNVSQKVAFLSQLPAIDGQLDEHLKHLSKRTFNFIWQFDNPVTDTIPITYRMAYTPTHFYLYIEVATDSINFRNRGYQNGDGFQLLFAKPQDDSLSNEFYNLCFSPSKDKDYWARQIIAEYNKEQGYQAFSKESLFEEKAIAGKCGFEALIAWNDIPPYHPWFLEEMGYNLYFAKAIGDTITNGYAVVEDEGIWDEEIPKRNFEQLKFEEPSLIEEEFILINPTRKNVKISDYLNIEVACISNKPAVKAINFIILDSVNKVFHSEKIELQLSTDLVKHTIQLKTPSFHPATYQLIATSFNDTLSQTEIVVFPVVDFNLIHSNLQENLHKLTLGTINTLTFKLQQYQQKRATLKPYENGLALLDYWTIFKKEYDLFSNGIDPYIDIIKPYRRAFLSKQDGTYQPYSIKLPENYDPNKTYPLLVFLHGSGQDEQGLLNRARSNGNFIELAPYARDIYYAYAFDYSQKDIIEAIEDVSKYFAVDRNKVIISGFSMGGYGALRTFYEHPERYKGVAVFAGHPHLASAWLDEEHPNFLNHKYLSSFKDVPVFIYHGTKDGALPVHLIEKMSQALHDAGALVTKSIVADRGHQYQDDKTNELYFDWLDKVLQE